MIKVFVAREQSMTKPYFLVQWYLINFQLNVNISLK